MADTKRRAEEQLAEIHKIFNEEDDNTPEGTQDIVKRIRAVLYGDAPPPVEPGDDAEDEEVEDTD